ARLIAMGQDVPPVRVPLEAPTWKLHELDWSGGDPPVVEIGRDDIAEIIFTSGATAEPKGVVITHRNVLANTVPIERELPKYRTWGKPFCPRRFRTLLPLSQLSGQGLAPFVPPMLPGVVVFMRGYNPVDMVTLIKGKRISVLVSVPKILDVLREHLQRVAGNSPEGVALKDEVAQRLQPGASREHFVRRWWRYRRVHKMVGFKFWAFVVGAAPLDAELEAFWKELGFVVIQGYGLTETAPIVSLNHPFSTKKGSVGKPIAGVEVKIAEDGEILVRGENVTRGYYKAAAETERAFEDGWFHTGDIGVKSPSGQIYIRGRKKEMIV